MLVYHNISHVYTRVISSPRACSPQAHDLLRVDRCIALLPALHEKATDLHTIISELSKEYALWRAEAPELVQWLENKLNLRFLLDDHSRFVMPAQEGDEMCVLVPFRSLQSVMCT